jgi:hypothetical protein
VTDDARALLFDALHAKRREVKKLLASKNECSSNLHYRGTELIRDHELLIAVYQAARALLNGEGGYREDTPLGRCHAAFEALEGASRDT